MEYVYGKIEYSQLAQISQSIFRSKPDICDRQRATRQTNYVDNNNNY